MMKQRDMNFQEKKTDESAHIWWNHVPEMKKIPIHSRLATFFASLNITSLIEFSVM